VSDSFELPAVDRVTVGALGEPGQRTFYLQARADDQLVTLKMEKQQVDALARLLGELLADLPTVGDLPDETSLELEEPAVAAWAVGTMQLAYDGESDRIVLLAEEIEAAEEAETSSDEPFGEPAGGVARLAVTREQAAAMAKRGEEQVRSGRPRCALCGFPIDPDGHACPKTNGHGPPSR
jgi:uncharacterized repeat protein (TIGR03847 family)